MVNENQRKHGKEIVSTRRLSTLSVSAMAVLMGLSPFATGSVAMAATSVSAPPLTAAPTASAGSAAGTTSVTAIPNSIQISSAQVTINTTVPSFTVTLQGTNLPQLTGGTGANLGMDYQNILIVKHGTIGDWASTVYNGGAFGTNPDGNGISNLASDTSTNLTFTVNDNPTGYSLDIYLLPAGVTLSSSNMSTYYMGNLSTDGTNTWTPGTGTSGNTLHYVVSNTALSTPISGSTATATVTGAPTSGSDLNTTGGDYVGVYELNSSDQVVAFSEVGPLARSQVKSEAPALSTTPTCAPGSFAGTTIVTAVPDNSGDMLHYVVSNTSFTIPVSGTAATPTMTGPSTNVSDLNAASGDYVGVYEVNSSNQVVAFSQVGPLTSSQVASNAPALNITPTIASGSITGTTSITAAPNNGLDTLHYVVSSTALSIPVSGTEATGTVIGAPTNGSDLNAGSGHYVGVYELNNSDQVVAFSQVGPLTGGQVASSVSTLSTTPTIASGSSTGTTSITAAPNNSLDTLHYVVSNTAPSTPVSGSTATATVTGAPTNGSDLNATSGDYVGVYELDKSDQIVAFSEVGPLTSSQVASTFSFNVSSNEITTGGTVTVTGSVYSGTGAAKTPLVNWPVDLSDSGQGSWSSNGQSTVSTVYSVYTNHQGEFTIDWSAPPTSGVYNLSATSNGQTQTQYVNVQKVFTSQVTEQQVSASGYTITKQLPSITQTSTSSTAIVSIPANAFTSSTPVFVNIAPSSNSIAISGKQTVSAIGVNFPGTPKKPITITIQNPEIAQGDSVYKILSNGTYQQVTSGVTIVPGTATITFTSDPNFVVTQPTRGGGSVPLTIIQDSFTEPATVGQNYSATIHEIGGADPMKWSVVSGSLPVGLSLDNQGIVSGTPTSAGTYTFTVKVTDANNLSFSKQLSLTVNGTPSTGAGSTNSGGSGTSTPPATPVSVTTSNEQAAIFGQAYHQALQATGGTGPYTWSIGSGKLPTGLSLNPNTGVISGTPSKPGIYQLAVQVKDSTGTATNQTLTVDILQPYQREVLWNGQVTNVPAIVQNEGTTATTYMPIWYVMQLLKPMGIASTWDGKHWHITTTQQTDMSHVSAGSGNTGIYLNGTLVQNVNTVAATDPSTHKPTTYMPIWYVMQLLKRVGLHSTWNGTTWTVTK